MGKQRFLTDFSVLQMAQKHGRQGSLVWSQPVVNTNDFDRFQALQWEIKDGTRPS
jgi:hypothetical protein